MSGSRKQRVAKPDLLDALLGVVNHADGAYQVSSVKKVIKGKPKTLEKGLDVVLDALPDIIDFLHENPEIQEQGKKGLDAARIALEAFAKDATKLAPDAAKRGLSVVKDFEDSFAYKQTCALVQRENEKYLKSLQSKTERERYGIAKISPDVEILTQATKADQPIWKCNICGFEMSDVDGAPAQCPRCGSMSQGVIINTGHCVPDVVVPFSVTSEQAESAASFWLMRQPLPPEVARDSDQMIPTSIFVPICVFDTVAKISYEAEIYPNMAKVSKAMDEANDDRLCPSCHSSTSIQDTVCPRCGAALPPLAYMLDADLRTLLALVGDVDAKSKAGAAEGDGWHKVAGEEINEGIDNAYCFKEGSFTPAECDLSYAVTPSDITKAIYSSYDVSAMAVASDDLIREGFIIPGSLKTRDAWEEIQDEVAKNAKMLVFKWLLENPYILGARSIACITKFEDVHAKCVLLPVWVSECRYKGHSIYIAVNGQNASVFERPEAKKPLTLVDFFDKTSDLLAQPAGKVVGVAVDVADAARDEAAVIAERGKKEMVKDIHRLANLGVRLLDFEDGEVIVHELAKSSLCVEVKEK